MEKGFRGSTKRKPVAHASGASRKLLFGPDPTTCAVLLAAVAAGGRRVLLVPACGSACSSLGKRDRSDGLCYRLIPALVESNPSGVTPRDPPR
jgi:hypothetical protein